MVVFLALLAASATPAPRPAATAEMRVSARIVRDACKVGRGRGPPPWSHARKGRLSASDGSPVPAIIYDLE